MLAGFKLDANMKLILNRIKERAVETLAKAKLHVPLDFVLAELPDPAVKPPNTAEWITALLEKVKPW